MVNTSMLEFQDQSNAKLMLPPIPSKNEIQKTWEEFESMTEEAYNSSLHVIRNNPAKSVALAFGVGLAAGYFLSRK